MLSLKNMVRIAMMSVIIAICSWLTIPSTVPFTMQTFAVCCAVLILGGKDGTLAICLYILLGIVGLPVFSGFRGGVSHIIGPTGGYIVGFIFMGICYWATQGLMKNKKYMRYIILAVGLVICYAIGTAWFVAVCNISGKNVGVWYALTMCVFPYIIPDIAKIVLAVVLSDRVSKAISKRK